MTSKAPKAGNKAPVRKTVQAAPKPPIADVKKTATPAPVPVPPKAEAPVAPKPAPVTATVEPQIEAVSERVTDTLEAATAPVEKIIEDTAPKMADTVAKGSDIMETTIEKTQAMFADMNERAKAAVEKNTKLVGEMTDFAKGNVEAMVESGKIAAKGFEAMGQDVAEYNRRSFESATATLKNMSSIKSPADFFKLQSDFMRQSFDSVVAETSKNTEAFMKLAGDAAQPISSRFAVAVEKVKAAA